MASSPKPWLLRVIEEEGRGRWGGLALGTDAAEQEDRHPPSSCSPLARAQSMADRSSSTNEESPMELGSQLGAPVVLGT